MLKPSRRVWRGTAVAALLALSPTLVGCGFNPQTNEIYQPAVGTNFRASQVDVLGAVVVADDSGEGRVIASFNNNDESRADAVTGISGADEDSDVQVDFGGEIELPPGELVNIADEPPVIASGAALVPGALVTLRYQFSNAEAVTFPAVIVPATDAYEGYAPGEPTPDPVDLPPPDDSEGAVQFDIGEGGDGGSAPLESGD